VPVPIRGLAAGIDRLVSSWPGINLLGDHTLTRWVKRRAPLPADRRAPLYGVPPAADRRAPLYGVPPPPGDRHA
jgi:hypothetical protein